MKNHACGFAVTTQRFLPRFFQHVQLGGDPAARTISNSRRRTSPIRACGTPASAASNSSARSGRTSQRKRVLDSANEQHDLGQIAFPRHVFQRQPGAQAAGKGHFGRGHRQPAFAQVVARPDQAGVDRLVQRREVLLGAAADRLRRLAAREPLDQGEMRTAQLVFVRPTW